MNKQHVIILRGLPASGKTTWAKNFINDNPTYKRVNRDDLRHMMNNYKFSRSNEEDITSARNLLIEDTLLRGNNVIIDETSLNPKSHLSMLYTLTVLQITHGLYLDIEVRNFEVSLHEAIIRDAKRDFSVGEKVIKKMYFDYLYKEHQENLIKHNPDLPNCIIVDVDGTLAIRGNRSPFDWKKVGEDKPNDNIINLVDSLCYAEKYLSVFIFSGRDKCCYNETYKWLKDNYVPFSKLVMREHNDNRKDSIIKKEFYEKHVMGKYNIKYWIDDRKQVIDEIRKLGITVLDVAGHEF